MRAGIRAAARGSERRRKEVRAAIVRFHAARNRATKLKDTPPWTDLSSHLGPFTFPSSQTASTNLGTVVCDHLDLWLSLPTDNVSSTLKGRR